MLKTILAVVGLIVGFSIGWLASKPKPVNHADLQTVSVFGSPGEDDDPDVDPKELSVGKTDVVVWLARSRRKHARIEFTEEVFEDMKHEGPVWVPLCSGRTCTSGAVKAGKGKYKYTQILHNPDSSGRKSKDGWIIIQ
ncbi:MAG: hypothetical protein M3167_07265 [Acidobacteriota bacterium]|nr:hypothetical protein [Acidobacteriota bacterium]